MSWLKNYLELLESFFGSNKILRVQDGEDIEFLRIMDSNVVNIIWSRFKVFVDIEFSQKHKAIYAERFDNIFKVAGTEMIKLFALNYNYFFFV